MNRPRLPWLLTGAVLFAGVDSSGQGQSQAAPAEDPTYQAAKDLFDQYAPPEVKEQYEFPSQDQVNAFLVRLQGAFDSNSLDQLAQYEPQAKVLLATLRQSPDTADTADWLEHRLDEMDAAREIRATELAESTPRPPPPTARPLPPITTQPAVPYYSTWLRRVQNRPEPAAAPSLMPTLQKAFAEEGAPPQLAWIAEVESSLNPKASNPSGARGLFQMKPETAKGLGLSTFLPDERIDPEKSAHAAARYLTGLHQRFGSWPLAIAAYNAGEGRVGRLLASEHATTYAQIASSLPSGTRMYVPEVCALCTARSGRPL